MNVIKRICIIGTGGFGKETLCCLIDAFANEKSKIEDLACFMVDDLYYKESEIMGIKVIRRSEFDVSMYNVVVAVGDPVARKKIVESLPAETTYATIIHPTVIKSEWVTIGEGSIVTAGVILTCNINVGKHAHLNLNSTIGHDCQVGDYFTTAPAVNISGNCVIGNCVYIGTNASVREKISICDNVIIGMGSVVLKSIDEVGVFVGSPLRKLE
ncbi:MAG: NeuD/PglB/VioB family sugar acetyltransferase [Sphingobacteriaceae bacterium]|nr:NeuD/PglB/VioB family sugar acetyltransferase [Sphingobacteriaceae bacterium]